MSVGPVLSCSKTERRVTVMFCLTVRFGDVGSGSVVPLDGDRLARWARIGARKLAAFRSCVLGGRRSVPSRWARRAGGADVSFGPSFGRQSAPAASSVQPAGPIDPLTKLEAAHAGLFVGTSRWTVTENLLVVRAGRRSTRMDLLSSQSKSYKLEAVSLGS
jgi:hypothetical protein